MFFLVLRFSCFFLSSGDYRPLKAIVFSQFLPVLNVRETHTERHTQRQREREMERRELYPEIDGVSFDGVSFEIMWGNLLCNRVHSHHSVPLRSLSGRNLMACAVDIEF